MTRQLTPILSIFALKSQSRVSLCLSPVKEVEETVDVCFPRHNSPYRSSVI